MNAQTSAGPNPRDQGKGKDAESDSTMIVHVEKVEGDESTEQTDTGKPTPRGPASVGSSTGGKTANEQKGGEGDEDSASQ
jgi:hypothetical protein